MKFRNTFALASVSLLALSVPAFAQDAADEGDADKDIVVTGTLIRGKAPVGQNAITVGQQKIQEIGAQSSNELLASLPQVSNYFNRVPVSDLAIAVNQIQISRPNLRNISGNNAASSATLILVDGHRIATAGVNQASIDPDLIPTGAIERVEVVTEGGSATYGADAVAGVINFITKKRVDGVSVNAHYGIADSYWQWDASITAGKAWDTGSAYLSYSYTKNDNLHGRERDYIRNVSYASQPYVGRDLTCVAPNLAINTIFVPANFTLSSVNYASPAFVANTFNRCDNSKDRTIVPKAERHGVFAGLSQELGDKTTIDVRAFYGQRKTRSSSVLTGTVPVGPANPFAAGNLPAGVVLGGGVVANQAAVSFSLLPVYGFDSQRSDTLIKEWGANAEIKHDLDDNWQLRGLLNWSQSDSTYDLTGLSNTRLAAAGIANTATTAINPFNIALTNRALLDDITNSEIAGQAKDNLINFRLIGEGKLFELPGGDVRLALGYEYTHDKLQQRFQSDIRIGTLGTFPFGDYTRSVHSAFGEVQVPLIADSKGDPMLTLQGSLRYDHYSDFGATTNPKVGVTFKPVPWFGLRGNWGTSFTAPTPLDQLGSTRNTVSAFPFVAFVRPGDTPAGGSFTVALQGSQPGLQPQTADTWSVGFDADPPFIPGLRANFSYYDVKFQNILRTPTPNAGIFVDFPGNITSNVGGVTPAQLRAFGALAPGGSAVVVPVFVIAPSQRRNVQPFDGVAVRFTVLLLRYGPTGGSNATLPPPGVVLVRL